MLRQYENSIDDKRQFTALVKDIFPEEAKNINLILMAYNMGIAQDIQRANLLNNTFAFRYVKQLMDDYGISRVNADWIVSVWCSCYGNLTVDLMNWYISSHNVGCPKHDGGELKGRLGKYGPYVTCTCGHTLKPHDI